MAYATVSDVQERMLREMSEREQAVCAALLDDAAIIIDSINDKAQPDIKNLVSVRMVVRSLGDGESSGIPIGATQGSMSGLGYAQSWTVGSGGSVGQLYIGKDERALLGRSNQIGSYSPVQELAFRRCHDEGDNSSISG